MGLNITAFRDVTVIPDTDISYDENAGEYRGVETKSAGVQRAQVLAGLEHGLEGFTLPVRFVRAAEVDGAFDGRVDAARVYGNVRAAFLWAGSGGVVFFS